MPSILRKALIFLILSTSLCFAEDSAKMLYDQGKYQEALELLQKNGLQSPADYYNAGNCYFRMGKPGQALSYYEKASTLAPNSEDILYNLKLAEESVEKRGALVRDQTFWTGRVVPLLRKFPEVYADIFLTLCTVGLAWISYRAKRRSLKFLRAISQPEFLMVFCIWSISGAFATANVLAHGAKLAAIVSDLGVARSGPGETFTELFKLPAGTKVELTGESRDGWSQVRFSLGNVGWIVEKDLLTL